MYRYAYLFEALRQQFHPMWNVNERMWMVWVRDDRTLAHVVKWTWIMILLLFIIFIGFNKPIYNIHIRLHRFSSNLCGLSTVEDELIENEPTNGLSFLRLKFITELICIVSKNLSYIYAIDSSIVWGILNRAYIYYKMKKKKEKKTTQNVKKM